MAKIVSELNKSTSKRGQKLYYVNVGVKTYYLTLLGIQGYGETASVTMLQKGTTLNVLMKLEQIRRNNLKIAIVHFIINFKYIETMIVRPLRSTFLYRELLSA